MNEDSSNLPPDVAKSLPGVYIFPGLTNQDPYGQYRFGLELAAAASSHDVSDSSNWGENFVMVTYTDGDKAIMDRATQKAGETITPITTPLSQETNDVNKSSPVAAKKKNKYGV